MKAGFVGFSGTLGTTAGLLGAGGKFALGSSILAGGSAITPVAPTTAAAGAFGTTVASTAPVSLTSTGTAGGALSTAATPISGLTTTASTGAFSTAAPITSSLSSVAPTTFSSTLGAGATTGGGTFIGGLGATPTGPMSLAPTTAAGTFTTSAPITTSSSVSVTGTATSTSPVLRGTTPKKFGFLNDLKEGLKGGVIDGARSLVSNGLYNLVMHGDIKGEKFEQDLTATGGGQASSYMGSYALPSAIDYEVSGIGGDTIGNTYVSMLQNLNYGTGSLDYARHTNMALMRGIQIPQIQYA